MTAAVRSTVDGRPCSRRLQLRCTSVYDTDRHASVNLVYHMDDYAEEKRTEHSLFVRSGKSEAEVTNKLRSTYCTIEANY